MPALQAIMTKMVPANQQGELQGSIASLNSIMQVLAPLVMTQLFGFFTVKDAPVYFPGAPFTLAGLSVLCGLAVLWLKTSDSTPTCTR
jgi:DHA1 family tetracycline resistance protein-like MFS transporter